MPGHTLDGRPIEQIGIVLEIASKALWPLRHQQSDVIFGGTAVDGHRLEGEFWQFDHFTGSDLQREPHLEQGRVAEIALRLQFLHQHLEGQVLMGKRAHHHPAHPLDELPKIRFSGQIRAKHQGVQEKTDEILNLRAVAVGNRRADADVILPGVPIQQSLKSGQHHHKEGRPFFAGKSPQLLCQFWRHLEREIGAVRGLHGWPGPIGRQRQ